MNKACMVPPECCVIIEMERGARLGYRRAVLLNEIMALGSLTKAARVTKIDRGHARVLVLEMNEAFFQPLVRFPCFRDQGDAVELTVKGRDVARAYWRRFEMVWLEILEERSRHY